MVDSVNERLNRVDELLARYPDLSDSRLPISEAAEMMIRCATRGGIILTCGNGGSSADSGHIVGELMKGFRRKRRISDGLASTLVSLDSTYGSLLAGSLQQPIAAIDLTAHAPLVTAFVNDQSADAVFAQQVLGYSNRENLLVCISTSGSSKNVILAAFTARSLGLSTIALTGKNGGELAKWCDVTISVPGEETAAIQELHLPVYHALCSIVEDHFFTE